MDGAIRAAEYVIYMTQGYCFYRILGSFLETKRFLPLRILTAVLCAVVVTMIIFPNDWFNITVNFPLFFGILLIGFKGKIIVKVSMVLLFFPIIIGINFLQMDMTGRLIISRISNQDSFLANLSWIMSLVSVLGFWFLFWKLLRRQGERIAGILDKRSWLLLDVICLASLTAVVSSVYFTPRETYKVWLCMLACVVTNIGSIRMVFYLADSIRSEMEKKNLKLQKNYYEELETNQREIRKFRHDMNNHFGVAAQLLEEGRDKDAREYFRQLSGQMSSKGRVFCKNSIVNAVLNAGYNKAVSNNIDCFFHIEIDELLFMDDIDICTLFSNTLDNAIEACMQIKDARKRNISVKARCTANGYFSYEIKNFKENNVLEKKGRYRSGKKEEKCHGFGIENVRDVVKRYQGTMEITYTEKEFCVVILISD